MLGPILQGERVSLIPTAPEMLPVFIRWLADLRVTRYLLTSFPPSLDREKEWFDKISKSETDIVWAIMVGEKLIGTSGLHKINWKHRNAVSGTMIGEVDEWNKGYATEAAGLRARFAFAELGLEKIKTDVLNDNEPSKRALIKNGYREAGILRHEEWKHGKWNDVWLGELLRDDWERRNSENPLA